MGQGTPPSWRLRVAGTFTIEPLEEPLAYWFRDTPAEISFAGYGQVFQELLDPASAMATHAAGLNVLLVRPLDWLRDLDAVSDADAVRTLVRRNASDLVEALRAASDRFKVPLLCVLCPAEGTWADVVDPIAAELATAAAALPRVTVVSPADIEGLYPLDQKYDAEADRLGHVPFTTAYYTALATVIARNVHAFRRPPRKVIAVDCDHTLWRGVVGEDGPLGVVVDDARRALQKFLIDLGARGMLVCLCSKNEEADVFEVLDRNEDMLLRRDHLVAWRINWKPKSENLRALAEELNLGLDSFVFLDDSPVECAEVEAAHADVTTLRLPEDADGIQRFVRHCWELDQPAVTAEDRARTAMYRENTVRERERLAAPDLETFIANLELHVDIQRLGAAQLTRAAQLTERTNQFNATTIRRSEPELAQALADGLEGLVVCVRDRFGDYGMVGLVLFRANGAESALDVDTFLMSCRVLGRRVEHSIVAHLGKLARERGLSAVRIPFLPTKKNQHFRDFIERLSGASSVENGSGMRCVVPVTGGA